MRVLTNKDIFKIFIRSFYIQGSWNYQRMLNLGFCYSILPILDKIYKKDEDRSKFLKRQLEFFNAHPYFASFALGATARLEEQYLNEQWSSDKPISMLKNRLCGPLGAIGDKLVWRTVKPLVAMLGVLITIFYGIVGPIVLIVVYNVPHVYLRYYGVVKGYKLGFDIVRELSKRKFERYSNYLNTIGLIVVGLFIGLYVLLLSKNQNLTVIAIFFSSMIISYPFIRSRKPVIVPIIVNISLFLGYAFFIGL